MPFLHKLYSVLVIKLVKLTHYGAYVDISVDKF